MAHRQRAISSWKVYHGLVAERRVDGPVGKRIGDHVGGPGDAQRPAELAPAERQRGRWRGSPSERASDRSRRAAEGQADQKNRQDDGEDIDRGAQQHAHQARPDHFRAQGAGAGKGDGEVDGHGGAAQDRRRCGRRGRAIERRRGRAIDAGAPRRNPPAHRGDGRLRAAAATVAMYMFRPAAGRNRPAGSRTPRRRYCRHKQPTEPRHAVRGGFEPAHDGGQGRAHQDGGRQQADGRHQAAQQHVWQCRAQPLPRTRGRPAA